MKIMKKQLLLIVLLLSVAASAFAVEVEIDGLWYEVVAKAKEAKVIKYKNDVEYSGDIVIPEAVVYEGTTCIMGSVPTIYECGVAIGQMHASLLGPRLIAVLSPCFC